MRRRKTAERNFIRTNFTRDEKILYKNKGRVTAAFIQIFNQKS